MSGHFHLFVYGTLRRGGEAASVLEGAELIAPAAVAGGLYDTGHGYPALVLAGGGKVLGEVWRCPAPLLPRLDEYEGVEERLFRRVGVEVRDWPCWAYVAGPKLARLLTADRRIPSGTWPAGAPTD